VLLTLLIVLPLAGIIPLLAFKDRNAPEIKVWALTVSFITLLLALPIWFTFDPGHIDQKKEAARAQLKSLDIRLNNKQMTKKEHDDASVEPKRVLRDSFYIVEVNRPWINLPGLKINYDMGLDGFSALLVLLSVLLVPLAILASFKCIKDRQKEYYIAMLVLQAALVGVFAARDLFLFYVFFEATLIPLYLMIGIWGGEQRVVATTRFVIYTVLGSLLMFVAILYIYYRTGLETFSIAKIADQLATMRLMDGKEGFSKTEEFFCFWAFVLAFAIKMPLFPVHTWQPDAYTKAPAPVTVLLSGVLAKLGAYGFFRLVIPFFPYATQEYIGLLAGLCLIGVVYGSMMAYVQTDFKTLLAYSSLAHLGLCLLGVLSMREAGVQGALFQLIAHGIVTGGLFLMAGMMEERTQTRAIEYYGGLAKSMPKFATCFFIFTLAAVGLPLTNGFVGEFGILLGAFQRHPVWALVGGTGMVLGAAYMLSLFQRVFLGKLVRRNLINVPDLSRRELALLLPLLILIFYMGLMPNAVLSRLDAASQTYLFQSSRKSHHPDAPRPGQGDGMIAEESPAAEPEAPAGAVPADADTALAEPPQLAVPPQKGAAQ